MSDNDDHRYVPAHDGPASCTGCGWESRRIGIASTTQHDAHLEDVARAEVDARGGTNEWSEVLG